MATYGQEQAEKLLKYYQGISGEMKEPGLMASQSEKEAYLAQEVRAGRAPEEMLPEAYGGRPKGTSRRAIRMQEAYDVEMARRASEERAMAAEFRAQEQFRLNMAKEAYDFRTKQNEDIFKERQQVDQLQAEAEFTEFRNKLNPNDPTSASMLYSYISSDPRLANSKIAYTSAEFFNKSAENSITSIALKQQEALNTAKSEARRAGIAEDQINKVIVGSRERDDQGNEFTNFNKALAEITKLTDTVIGKRTIGEEERKEGRGEYRPMSVEQAQDEFDIANAEFGAIQEAGLDEEDPDFVKAQGRLRRAEAQLNVSKERSQTAERPKQEGLKIPSITSKEELDALPSGSEYIAPNGKRYRKK